MEGFAFGQLPNGGGGLARGLRLAFFSQRPLFVGAEPFAALARQAMRCAQPQQVLLQVILERDERVELVPAEKVQANDYNPNQVANPEMKLLAHSIEEDGLTMALVAYYDAAIDRYIVPAALGDRAGVLGALALAERAVP